MRVDDAGEEDLPAVLPLMRSYCDFYGANPSDAGLERMARALIAADDDEGMLLVARDDDGMPVGFAAASWKWSSLRGAQVAILEDLFVAPEARGAGIAGALIGECGRRASAAGAPALLWQTAPGNARARAAYTRTGASAGTWLEYELELGQP